MAARKRGKKSASRSVDEAARRSPGNDDFVITARRGRPFASGNGPLFVAEAGPFLRGSSHRIEGRNDVGRAVGDVRAARNRRFVHVHRVRIFEGGKTARL